MIPVILATREVEIGKIIVTGQPRKKNCETPSQQQKAGCGGMHLSSQLLQKA
jgi:hypothetical protein